MKVKHNKIKNTGILFEMLTRQITSDVLAKREPYAAKILKKYFRESKGELMNEYKLYNAIITSHSLNESKGDLFIRTIVDAYKKIDKKKLNTEKYNLLSEIKKYYDLETFFKVRIPNYNVYASTYSILKESEESTFNDPLVTYKHKSTLLEHVSREKPVQENSFSELKSMSRGERQLIIKLMVENFNEKYKNMLPEQRSLMKSYICNVNNQGEFAKIYVDRINEVKVKIGVLKEKVDEPATKIKLNEVYNNVQPLKKGQLAKDSDISNLMQYYDLIEELKKVTNG